MHDTPSTDKVGAVLIVGGGIGGIQASLDLANSGFKVFLSEAGSAIGGLMAMLDKTFPTNDCSMCIMAPKLVECGRHLNITVIPNSTIESLQGEAGNFTVRLRKKARYVDLEKCTGCGECRKHCPVEIFDDFNQGLSRRKSIYINYPQAVPSKYLIDKENCLGCGVCERVCLAGAVKYCDTDVIEDINVGAVILACGTVPFDATVYSKFGYGRYTNVVTSIDFERILSASGPFQGHLLRPYDGKEPKRIAFIQCVGSRDPESGKNYCSSVCCTYAIKEAIIAKEHAKGNLEPTIFFMDIRTFGKGFEAYYERAKSEYGVQFVRAGVSRIDEDTVTKDLIVHYESEDGQIREERYDMVILSVGLVTDERATLLAKRLRINLNDDQFCRTSEFMPVETLHDGIYVCGTFSGPKDIPETVTQASAAAARVMGFLAPARNALTVKKEYPHEIDIVGQTPRIGVFVCHCGINIGGYLDVPEVVEHARDLPNVVYAEQNLYTCSQDTQKKIVDVIKEHRLNRVVVASCTPRTHEPLFRETIREAGLNPYLFEMANIRDQCSWIHMAQHREATDKAKELLSLAVAKAGLLIPLKQVELGVIQKALVIGGGVAGMTTSLSLAEQGFEVYLVEKEAELGGHLRHIHYTIEKRDVQQFLKRIIAEVERQDLIKVFRGAHIESVSGFIGSYETEITTRENTKEKLKHGVIVVATGAKEYAPSEYERGRNPIVITQRELEAMIANSTSAATDVLTKAKSVVMIQCIGSRDTDHNYCSRICCSQTMKNAVKLLQISPDVSIYVLYRDIRTYGLKEDAYRKARESGVTFMRYSVSSKPRLFHENGVSRISVWEPILKENFELTPDLIVLSSGIEAEDGNKTLAKMLKVPLNNEGFFLEAHVKLRPVDFATEGVFVAGMAHSPKDIDEAISQAEAAAARAAIIIAQDKYRAEAVVSHVNEDLCAGCGVCSTLCPYEAIEIVVENGVRKSKVNEALCKGCGTCASACPAGAMDQYGFARHQIMAMIEALE